LITELGTHPRTPVPISVRGEVRAFLVAAERFEELQLAEDNLGRKRPPRLFRTLPYIGDLEKGSRWAAQELEESAIRRARRVGFID
jgi:hypothetical protein